ncbi:MAG: MBL fold metallo-hydrolase [Planctomycetes bacterium]|nr:MBL fold metallo-hydrolase [Planctomycetota bacterium]
MQRIQRTNRFGDWRVDLLECGRFALDGGAMFGSVPRVLWERWIAPDASHRIPMVMRVLLLRNEALAASVLVDAGIGDKFDERFRSMFDIHHPGVAAGRTPLAHALGGAGVAPERITHVVLTHLHFDHAGGSTVRAGGEALPAFPRARHFLQAANLETAARPNLRERASYLPENFEPLRALPLDLLRGSEEILPGLRVFVSNGHTQGMQCVRLEGGGGVLYYLADLAPTHHHLRVPYTMGYDLSAREIMEEKQRLWPRIIEEEAVIVFEHDSQLAAATLEERDGKHGAAAAVTLE